MALSGIIKSVIGPYNQYDLTIEWQVNNQYKAERTSNITVVLKCWRNDETSNSNGAYNLAANNTIKLSVGGSLKVDNTTATIDLRSATPVTLASWTGDVPHNSNGELGLELIGSFYFNAVGADSLPQGEYCVSGMAVIDPINGLVRILNGSSSKTEFYQPYIRKGANWDLYDPHIHASADWKSCL